MIVNNLKSYFEIHNLPKIFIFGLCLAAPFSRSLFSICFIGLLISFFLGGSYGEKLSFFKQHYPSLFFLLFFIFMVFSSSYTKDTTNDLWVRLSYYLKFLIIPIVPFYISKKLDFEKALYFFIIGGVILLPFSFLVRFHHASWIPRQNNDLMSVFYNALPQSMALVFLTIFSLYFLFRSEHRLWKYLFSIIMLCATASIFWISSRRIAMICWLIAISLLLMQYFKNKQRIFLIFLLIISSIVVVYTQNPISKRISETTQDIHKYAENSYDTSSGLRLLAWKVTSEAIVESPLIGHGVASYASLAEKKLQNSEYCSVICSHPHQQYLLILVEYGIIGFFILFIAISYATVYAFRNKNILQILIIIVFFINSFVDCTLTAGGYIHLFAPLLGLVFCQIKINNEA